MIGAIISTTAIMAINIGACVAGAKLATKMAKEEYKAAMNKSNCGTKKP